MRVPIRKFPGLTPRVYADLRPEIKNGDLLLCSGEAFVSMLIRRATSSVWSHVAFVLRLDEIDRIMVLESVESQGVRTVPLSHYVSNYKGEGEGYPGRLLLARHANFPAAEPGRLREITQFAVDLFGHSYDKEEIVRILSLIGRDWLGLSDVAGMERDRKYICSEYVWECYNNLGISIARGNRGYVAPRDFAADSRVRAVAEIAVAS